MMVGRRSFLLGTCACALAGCAALAGCVDQHPERSQAQAAGESAGDGGSASEGQKTEPRIVATTPAILEICNRLELDLVGIPQTSSDVPERYQGLFEVGTPMAPDLEKLKSVHPDYVISPTTLQEDLEPKYEAAGVEAVFCDLRSVDGLYDSADKLGKMFDRTEQAFVMRMHYEKFLIDFAKSVKNNVKPSVLVLMGVPGSYLVATENSYVGSLVAQAGGRNVYDDTDEEFLNVNTEDMQSRDADVILRAAHGLPDDVREMFAEEFATNDIWSHFRAVKEGRVYDLSYELFGMSATFDYPEAFEELRPYLYGSVT